MQYDLNLAANSSQRLEVAGTFFKYKSGPGAVRVTTNKGEYVDLIAGQSVYGVEYSSLSVQDKSGLQNNGALIAGDFDFRDDTISGSVRFVDGASDVVALGTCFYGHGELSPTGTPANAPGHFLTNLAGSNKTLIVKKITVVSTWGVRLYIDPVAKAGGTAGINKKWGGAASVAAKVGASDDDPTTTMLGWTRVYTLAGSLATPSVGIQIIKFDEPIRLPPNTALHVKAIAGSGSTYIDANFEWTEE